MRPIRLFAFAFFFVFAFAAALPARAATDYTDIWWAAGGTESGWGINLAQNGNTIFATFFVYNVARVPVWYTALLTRSAGETFTGQVVASNGGAWFGSPTWTAPTNVAVGSAAFVGDTPYRGTLTYSIDGVPVTKTIERTTLGALNVAGTYLGGVTGRRSGCTSIASGSILDVIQMVVTQSGPPSTPTIRIDQLSTVDGALICRMEGPGTQYGGIIDVPSAAYSCPQEFNNATAHIIGLRPTATGFEARWFMNFGGGCTESGNLSGATQLI